MPKQSPRRREKVRKEADDKRPAQIVLPRCLAAIAQALENRLLLSTTFQVTTTADSGAGSLRQAITSADQTSGSSIIDFSIATGSQTIAPLSALPNLTAAITLDGTTQPGYAGTPLIVLNGSSAGSSANGIDVMSSGCIIRGLDFENFAANGIFLNTGGGDTVQGDYLGVAPSGSAAAGNGASGVLITSPNNLIGGPIAADRNIISGNTVQGVNLNSSTATANLVEGNYIGTNAAGTAPIANAVSGVCIYAAGGNTIGGSATGDGNLVSGNSQDGIVILGGASSNTVAGNLLGTDVSGTSAVPNGFYGIEVDSAGNVVGGTTPAARNIISGNADAGVVLFLSSSNHNLIEGNYIGPDITGTQLVGTQPNGVDIDDGATHNTVGGTTPAARNIISGNLDSGVGFFGSGTSANIVSGNYIGTTANGMSALGNGVLEPGGQGPGVLSDNNASGNTIGGAAVGAGNLISANGTGIVLFDNGETAQGNLLGANSAGIGSLPNGSYGVLIYGNNNTVGGPVPADANTIFGNTANAIHLGSGTGNVIQGNISQAPQTTPTVTLTTPAGGSSTNNNTPIFSGAASTATADSPTVSIDLYPGSSASGTALQILTATWNPSTGSYSIPGNSALPDGTYTAQASESDGNGDIGYSTADTFTIDIVSPVVTLTAPLNGNSTNINQPTFSGAAGTATGDLPATTINIYAGAAAAGTPVQTLTATATAGVYSIADSSALPDGTYTAQSSQSDAAGNTGTSSPDTFTIDTVPPSVTLTAPATGSTISTSTPTFTGAAGAAAGDLPTITVNIYSGAAATGTPVQTLTTTASAGSYSIAANTALPDGTYTAQASQFDIAGNIGTSAADTFTVDSGGAGIVSVAATAPAASLFPTLQTGTYTFTLASPLASPLAVAYTLAGAGVLGTDYSLASPDSALTAATTGGTITFAAGATTATITLTPLSTAQAAGSSAALTVASSASYLLGASTSAIVTIASIPSVSVAATDPSATVGAMPPDPGTWTLTRTGPAAAALAANFALTGTAAEGTDYSLASSNSTLSATITGGTITFAPGTSTATITLTPLATAGGKAATLTLASGPYNIAAATGATITIAAAPVAPALADADIGSPGKSGSASFNSSTGVWTVSGGGADIWNNSDQFNFTSTSVSGNATLTTEVTSLTATDPWAKAGLMFRDGAAANAANIAVVATAANGVSLQWRTIPGGSSSYTNIPGVPIPSASAPVWLQLIRAGNVFTASYSTTGTTYKSVASETITMDTSLLAGLAVTAHNNALLATATFANSAIPYLAAPIAIPGIPTLSAAPATGAASLSWSPVAGATSYNLYRSTATGAEGATPYLTGLVGTADMDTAVTPGTPYYYTLTAVNSAGQSSQSTQTSATPTASSSTAALTDADVGSPGKTGSASLNSSTGVWTVSGGGADIWNTSDQFDFASTSVSGNATLTTEVTSLSNTDPWAKAGLMFRDGSAASAANVALVATPGNGVSFQWRTTPGGASNYTNISGIPLPTPSAPIYLKLVRAGNVFTAYYSTTGTSYTLVGTETITLDTALSAGLAVTAHNNTLLATATFANVSV